MQAEDKIVIIRTSCSAANVISRHLPSYGAKGAMHSYYTSVILHDSIWEVVLQHYPQLAQQ